MKTVIPMTFEQAKALAGLYMVSDPSPLPPDENALVEGVLASASKAFGFDSWVDLYHAKELFCESPHTLTEAHSAIATLKSMATHIAESSRAASAHIQACQQSVGQSCEALVKGIDVAMFEVASKVIYISHSDKEIRMIDRARADVLGGFKTMRLRYFGSKHYAQFSYQDSTYEYWAYPSYGRIVSDIGMVKSARGRDISAEEVEACLYALEWPYEYAAWLKAKTAGYLMAAPSISTRTARTKTKAKQAWLEERRTYLGATDISAIMGINPYQSPHDVWLAKKGPKEDESKIAMRVGTYLEPFIAREFEHQKGAKVRRSRMYRHSKFGFLACNPDREFTLDVDPCEDRRMYGITGKRAYRFLIEGQVDCDKWAEVRGE